MTILLNCILAAFALFATIIIAGIAIGYVALYLDGEASDLEN